MSKKLITLLSILLAVALILPLQARANLSYIGCYIDSIPHDLTGYSFTSDRMTPELCVSTCRRHGFKYAALEFSINCRCGNSYGIYGKAPSNIECNYRCSGNSNEICGGYWRESVYSTRRYQSVSSTVEWNTDRPGYDFKSIVLPKADPMLCKRICMNNPRCKAWTYVKPYTIQGSAPKCWLKYTVPRAIYSRYCVSGVIKRGSTQSNKNSLIVITIRNPKVNGVALDMCKKWGKECGKPAADAYCRAHGYIGALSYKVQYDTPPTRVISTGQICNTSFCDRIVEVKCFKKRNSFINRVVTIKNPTVGGLALDLCRDWGKNCGMPAADAYCKDHGYKGALSYKVKKDTPPTRVISTGRICNKSYCDRIVEVKCLRY